MDEVPLYRVLFLAEGAERERSALSRKGSKSRPGAPVVWGYILV